MRTSRSRRTPRMTGHCYRMLGSVVDADDAVQNPHSGLEGVRSLDGRSSLRTWLYWIATNVRLTRCRNARGGGRWRRDPPVLRTTPLEERSRTHWLSRSTAHAIFEDASPGRDGHPEAEHPPASWRRCSQPPRQRAALILASAGLVCERDCGDPELDGPGGQQRAATCARHSGRARWAKRNRCCRPSKLPWSPLCLRIRRYDMDALAAFCATTRPCRCRHTRSGCAGLRPSVPGCSAAEPSAAVRA